MKKPRIARPVIAATLPNKGNRMVYEYRIHHINWTEKANITGRQSPFSFINLQYKVYPPHHFFPSHSHPMFEFYAVTRGQVIISLGPRGENPVELGAGTAILMAPHQFHSANSDRPAEVLNVHFTPKWRATQKKAMLHICGQRLRLGKVARKNISILKKLPAGKSSDKSAKVLITSFNCVLEELGRSNAKARG